VFFSPHAAAFWRRSKSTPDSSMVEMHRAEKIAQEIKSDYRGHHFFRWNRPREVWYEASAPVFIDFGGHELLRLGRYSPPTQWVAQRISKQALLEKNGGTYTPPAEGG
jgi:competence protein CoiA